MIGRDPGEDDELVRPAYHRAVKIRAVTLGMDLPWPQVDAAPFRAAAEFLQVAQERLAGQGVEVQTLRVAGGELGPLLGSLSGEQFRAWATDTERTARDAGVGYLSLGRVPGSQPDAVRDLAAPTLAAGEIAFLSADLLDGGRPSLKMAQACGQAVHALAHATELGFGNLRFAATASCPPNIPFLPAAYHVGGQPRFAIAVQAADVVLQALQGSDGLEEAEDRLVDALESVTRPIEETAVRLSGEFGYPFVGIDLSPAPFPSDEESIGGAIEAAGVDRFGAPGTLYVAALITRALRRTRLQRSGFSGLMLPVLEDTVLARRAAERPTSLHELLLYSAVCGTGLDTVPVPGDTPVDALAGIFLDVAGLSVALNGKPLTARLLPVPGAAAGDPTVYDFAFFSNSRVSPSLGGGAGGLLARGR